MNALTVPILLVNQALSPDPAAAIASLRDLGPPGLDALVEHGRPGPALRTAMDLVGAQRDNVCGLYWFTDLDKARDAARAENKPIVSLRLLGRLDEDLSCANSRFIRTAIYANEQIATVLKDRFILHWQSVRPAPRITIDFGDGRRIERTITGNSLHYLLDIDGRPLEVLPGLCGPGPFLRWLEESYGLFARLQLTPRPQQRAWKLRSHHAIAFNRLVTSWQRDLAEIGAADGAAPLAEVVVRPTALAAAPVAVTKALVEMPMVAMMASLGDRLAARTDQRLWPDLAELYRDGARLAPSSVAVMARKTTVTPAMIDRFEQSLAEDAVRNEYVFHRRIHQWFAAGEVGSLPELTARIYDELFLTPDEDPWLGLLPAGIYAALEKNGVTRP